MDLVKIEDVVIEQNVMEQKGEFRPNDHIVDMIKQSRDHVEHMFNDMGFKGFVFVHHRYGHNVHYFAKTDVVIMIDCHGLNTLSVEVLNEEEREWFMESIEEHLGQEELEQLKESESR